MLPLVYSASTVVGNPNINVVSDWQYGIGANIIEIKIGIDVDLKIDIYYQVPMAASTLDFGLDLNDKITIELKIRKSTLSSPIATDKWQPRIVYANSVLYLSELPKGRIEVVGTDPIEGNRIYTAYFETGRQIPGRTRETNPIDLTYDLYRAAACKDYTASVSSTAATVKIVLELGFLPKRIVRYVGTSINQQLDLDRADNTAVELGSNLVAALYLLHALYKWRAVPQAQQLDTGLETNILSALDKIATLARNALDLRTGLVFEKQELNVYSRPSYVATAIALILWHELSDSFDIKEHLIPLSKSWDLWKDLTYNPDLESQVAFDTAQELIKTYRKDNTTVSVVPDRKVDCTSLSKQYMPVIAFLSNVTLETQSELPKLLSLPRTALTLIESVSVKEQLNYAIYLQSAMAMMPVGYFWPTASQINKRSSIWGAIFRTVASSLATSALLQNKEISTFSPNLDLGSAVWLDALLPPTPGTPLGYWRSLAKAYLKSPKLGVGNLEWTAYLSGLLPLSTTLNDYRYLQMPLLRTVANLPNLESIEAIAPEDYTAIDSNLVYPFDRLDNSLALPTLEAVYLESLAPFGTEDRIADRDERPVDFTVQTNRVALFGEGKPKSIQDNCLSRNSVGVVCQIYFHTWGEASSNLAVVETFNSLDSGI